MNGARLPAVEGVFYPADRQQLEQYLRAVLSRAANEVPRLPGVQAIVAPHAGYRYSGPVAARAYAALLARGRPQRILLLGPAHTMPLRGIAAPAWDAFSTPLGTVPVDRQARRAILHLPWVVADNLPHMREHALEVQLPFIQALYGDIPVLPLVVGETTPEQVAEVIETVRALHPDTLVIVSSDLSHYEPYDQARIHDARTARAIATLDATHIGPHDACGVRPLAGLLHAARQHHWKPVLLDLRNSGDTAGSKDRVVGYGAWAFVDHDSD